MKSLDIFPILYNFYRDIYDDDERSNWEAYLLLILPIPFAVVSLIRPIDDQFISTMSTALAVLFGFTFNSLMITARYSTKNDRLEEMVVRQARLGTSYALFVNLTALLLVISASIAIVDYSEVSYQAITAASAGVYYILFHYLFVVFHLLRYMYLLAVGGAFEDADEQSGDQTGERSDDLRKVEL